MGGGGGIDLDAKAVVVVVVVVADVVMEEGMECCFAFVK